MAKKLKHGVWDDGTFVVKERKIRTTSISGVMYNKVLLGTTGTNIVIRITMTGDFHTKLHWSSISSTRREMRPCYFKH